MIKKLIKIKQLSQVLCFMIDNPQCDVDAG